MRVRDWQRKDRGCLYTCFMCANSNDDPEMVEEPLEPHWSLQV